jgi:hypothetical protein
MLVAVRYVLPAVLCVAGVALIAFGGRHGLDGGLMLIGGAAAVALLNFLHRMGVSGDRDRDEEEEARLYFDRHGHWPDETPGSGWS